jgi:ribosomal protein L40E
MLIQLAISGLDTRKKVLGDIMPKGLLPFITSNPDIISSDYILPVINLTGFSEALLNLIGDRASHSEQNNLSEKIIQTVTKFAQDKSHVKDRVEVAILDDTSAERFFKLDTEKYGKSTMMTTGGQNAYSQTPRIHEDDLSKDNMLEEFRLFNDNLNGGFSVSLDVPPKLNIDAVSKIVLDASQKLDSFKLNVNLLICINCGAKLLFEVGKCTVCKSTSLLQYSTSSSRR